MQSRGAHRARGKVGAKQGIKLAGAVFRLLCCLSIEIPASAQMRGCVHYL